MIIYANFPGGILKTFDYALENLYLKKISTKTFVKRLGNIN